MPPRRKQQLHRDIWARADTTPRDKMRRNETQSLSIATPNSLNKRKHPADDTSTNPTPAPSSKKLKTSHNTSSPPTLAPPPTPKPRSTLIPRGPRQTATLHTPSPSLLRMTCDSTTTPSKVTDLHFRAIPHSAIDWSNADHIRKINAWRNQIYGRAGLKARTVSAWHEDEELWFELWFQASIREARKDGRGMGVGVLMPGVKVVREAFNGFFQGRRLSVKSKNGVVGVGKPRGVREANAFASKFARVCPALRARLASCCVGRVGDVFMPVITPKMLDKYRSMKSEMVARGCEEESAYKQGLEDWRWFFGNLPTEDEDEGGKEEGEKIDGVDGGEDTDIQEKEVDAIAALMSLAHSPHTPDLSSSTRASFSQASLASDTPATPHDQPPSFQHTDYHRHSPHHYHYINSIVRGEQHKYHASGSDYDYEIYEDIEDMRALHHRRYD